MVLYETIDERVLIDRFIYKQGLYKPIDFIYGTVSQFRFIPSKWLQRLTQSSDIEQVNKQKQAIKAKKNKPKLDDILVEGKSYLIGEEYSIMYSHKEKRSFIFILDEKHVKFSHLEAEDVKPLE